jgi:Ni/Co efflux regulator RcnB
MKKLLITVAALSLLGAPAAFAQQQDDQHRHDRGGNGQQQGGGQGQQQSGAKGQAQSQAQSHAGMRYDQSSGWIPNQAQTQSHPGMRYDQSSGWIPNQGQAHTQGQDRYRNNQGGGAQGQDRYRNNQGGGSQGQDRYRSYQRGSNAERRFRLPGYRWPQGSSYRRYSYGQFLPRIFFGQDYWLYDYSDYGLPYPPPGAAWVRYGPDALMIDRHTGEIIEVVYGVFY